jgi:hypothetical protein
MANNILQGFNVVVAKTNIAFTTAGLNSTNLQIIYKVSGSLQSYIPGRAINGITGFETDKGYYLVAKQALDLSSIVEPSGNVFSAEFASEFN